MIIRVADLKDIPGVLRIYNHAVLHSTATYDYEPRTIEHRTEWFEDHRRTRLPIFVAVDKSDHVLGWSCLNRYHERMGYRYTTENSIYVDDAHRGQGIGKALLAPLIDAGRALGVHVILAGIDASNQASLRLHAGFGFEKVGHFKQVGHKFDRWLDVVYMEKIL